MKIYCKQCNIAHSVKKMVLGIYSKNSKTNIGYICKPCAVKAQRRHNHRVMSNSEKQANNIKSEISKAIA